MTPPDVLHDTEETQLLLPAGIVQLGAESVPEGTATALTLHVKLRGVLGPPGPNACTALHVVSPTIAAVAVTLFEPVGIFAGPLIFI